jgi:hypothetical protein
VQRLWTKVNTKRAYAVAAIAAIDVLLEAPPRIAETLGEQKKQQKCALTSRTRANGALGASRVRRDPTAALSARTSFCSALLRGLATVFRGALYADKIGRT